MKSALLAWGLAAVAQAASLPENFPRTGNVVTEVLTDCKSDFHGRFEISAAPICNSKRIFPSYCGTAANSLVLTLTNGGLKDAKGRTGYIASNHQLQFDAPPQFNALRTSGFSICDGNVLALGNSKVFYECLADKFYNLYDAKVAPQCRPATITVWACDGPDCPEGGHSNKPPLVWEIPDGQIQAPWTGKDDCKPNLLTTVKETVPTR